MWNRGDRVNSGGDWRGKAKCGFSYFVACSRKRKVAAFFPANKGKEGGGEKNKYKDPEPCRGKEKKKLLGCTKGVSQASYCRNTRKTRRREKRGS